MGTFRKVEGEEAGADALGILIPPSRRTFVILRPRGLPWDLVMCRVGGGFRELSHDEASAAAQGVYRALRDGAGAVVVADEGSVIRATVGPFDFVACARRPGQAYAPHVCAAGEVASAVAGLAGVLSPGEGGEQEVYFNTRFFERSMG